MWKQQLKLNVNDWARAQRSVQGQPQSCANRNYSTNALQTFTNQSRILQNSENDQNEQAENDLLFGEGGFFGKDRGTMGAKMREADKGQKIQQLNVEIRQAQKIQRNTRSPFCCRDMMSQDIQQFEVSHLSQQPYTPSSFTRSMSQQENSKLVNSKLRIIKKALHFKKFKEDENHYKIENTAQSDWQGQQYSEKGEYKRNFQKQFEPCLQFKQRKQSAQIRDITNIVIAKDMGRNDKLKQAKTPQNEQENTFQFKNSFCRKDKERKDMQNQQEISHISNQDFLEKQGPNFEKVAEKQPLYKRTQTSRIGRGNKSCNDLTELKAEAEEQHQDSQVKKPGDQVDQSRMGRNTIYNPEEQKEKAVVENDHQQPQVIYDSEENSGKKGLDDLKRAKTPIERSQSSFIAAQKQNDPTLQKKQIDMQEAYNQRRRNRAQRRQMLSQTNLNNSMQQKNTKSDHHHFQDQPKDQSQNNILNSQEKEKLSEIQKQIQRLQEIERKIIADQEYQKQQYAI